eukprot:8520568-Pyramimonas_sp.AAC.1
MVKSAFFCMMLFTASFWTLLKFLAASVARLVTHSGSWRTCAGLVSSPSPPMAAQKQANLAQSDTNLIAEP